MKKFVAVLVALLLAFPLTVFAESEPKAGEGVTITVYNWGEYIDPTVNELFTAETGIKVNYKNFTDNESMYAMLSSGTATYDVIVPSDYMVGKLIREGLLAKLNYDNIPNYRYISDSLKDQAYDPENA